MLNFDQLNQLEYLLSQSAKGNHVLFNRDQIKKVFSQEKDEGNLFEGPMSFKKIDEVRKLIEELLKQPTLVKKKEFINHLSEESQTLVIRAYFNILDNTLYPQKGIPLH